MCLESELCEQGSAAHNPKVQERGDSAPTSPSPAGPMHHDCSPCHANVREAERLQGEGDRCGSEEGSCNSVPLCVTDVALCRRHGLDGCFCSFPWKLLEGRVGVGRMGPHGTPGAVELSGFKFFNG